MVRVMQYVLQGRGPPVEAQDHAMPRSFVAIKMATVKHKHHTYFLAVALQVEDAVNITMRGVSCEGWRTGGVLYKKQAETVTKPRGPTSKEFDMSRPAACARILFKKSAPSATWLVENSKFNDNVGSRSGAIDIVQVPGGGVMYDSTLGRFTNANAPGKLNIKWRNVECSNNIGYEGGW